MSPFNPTSGRGATASTLLRGVTVIDGTGADEYVADVLVAGGLTAAIAAAGTVSSREVERVVECAGLALAPGFIDVHSHADGAPFLEEDDASKISQGVTTEVVGNCGFSLAPCPPDRRDEIAQMCGRLFPSMDFTWSTAAELFRRLDTAGHLINTVSLVGHHTLRSAAMGMGDRPPTDAELRTMRRELQAGLSSGASGLSSGLAYPPGMFGDVEELAALASTLSSHHVYATHLRSEGSRLLDSVDEAIDTAQRADCRLQVSHLKAAGNGAWGDVKLALEKLDAAYESGLDVHHDVYPYQANSTMLTSCLPPWFHDGGHEAVLARLRDPDLLRRCERELLDDDGTWDNWVAGSGWDKVLISSTADHRYEGLHLDEVAHRRGTSPFNALVDLLVENDLRVWMCVFAMHEDDVRAALRHPRAMIGSDGPPPGNGGKPHPRLYGTFTRVLARYVREDGVLSLPEAVAKMTSLPASVFGLTGRGVVRTGAVADLVLFDPLTVADEATFVEPLRRSSGVELVMVDGKIAFERGRLAAFRGGQRLSSDSHHTP